MSRHLIVRFLVQHNIALIRALLLCGYYALWAVICFPFIAQHDAVLELSRHTSVVQSIAVWGFVSGCSLFIMLQSSMEVDFLSCLKQRQWMKASERLLCLIFCQSVFLAPILIMGSSVLIKALCTPLISGTFILLFLIAVTGALFQSRTVNMEHCHVE